MFHTTLLFINKLNKFESAIFVFFNVFVAFKGSIFLRVYLQKGNIGSMLTAQDI